MFVQFKVWKINIPGKNMRYNYKYMTAALSIHLQHRSIFQSFFGYTG